MAIGLNDVGPVTALLSPERLAALSALTGSPQTAILFHQETLKLGSMLMNVIASIEISVRNSVATNLAQHFAVPDWLSRPPVGFAWRPTESEKIRQALSSARRAEYSKLTQAQKANLDILAWPRGRPGNLTHSQRSRARQKQIPVSEGKIIAELTMYFWKRVFSPEYEHTLWKPSLRRIFPDKRVTRSQVAIHLENVYQARNRLAHHEPVLHGRFSDAITGIIYISEHIGAYPPSNQTPLAKLLSEDLDHVVRSADDIHRRLQAFRVTTTS